MTLTMVFTTIFSALNVFSSERPVFIRERLRSTYFPSSYFMSRMIAFLPLDLVLPFLMIVIPYFVVNLDNDLDNFFKTVGPYWLGAFMSSGYGMLISAIFADPQVSVIATPTLIFPLLMLAGFFAPLQKVHDFFKWLEYTSMFRYTY